MSARGGTAYGLDTQRGDHWTVAAICRDQDPEIWYPVGHTGPAIAQAEKAIAVCEQCPVRLACLLDAIRFPAMDQHGIAAGLTADQRGYFVNPCTNGHERNARTLAFEGGMPYCVPCRRLSTAEWWASNGAELATAIEDALSPQPAPQPEQVPSCAAGLHLLTEANRFGAKANRCRACTAEKTRAAHLRKLGWRREMAEVSS
jgi:WhiB family redox-sensing transcriptional regulator